VRTAFAIALLVIAACAGNDAAPRSPEPDLRSGLVSAPPTGRYSGVCAYPEERTVIRTPEDWRQTWSELFACTSPAPPVPSIDFEREMVLLAALGERTSGGFRAAILRAEPNGDGVLVVDVAEYRPGDGCFVTTVMTYPVAVARVPRREGAVAFDTTVHVVDCE
jgi:hypothetical protein